MLAWAALWARSSARIRMHGAAGSLLALAILILALIAPATAAAQTSRPRITQSWPVSHVRTVQQPELHRSFTLNNDTGAALTGLRLQVSSPAAVRVLGRLTGSKLAPAPVSEGARLPDLPPGQGLALTVYLNLARLQPGPVRQQVAVTAGMRG